eukprot:COSAG04_NODE_848_length_9881_cov_5.280822_1_plen_131_part_00
MFVDRDCLANDTKTPASVGTVVWKQQLHFSNVVWEQPFWTQGTAPDTADCDRLPSSPRSNRCGSQTSADGTVLCGAPQVALYVSMGAGGYYLFGTSVSSDILVSFPLDDPSIIVGRVAVSFVAAVSATAR